MPRVGIGDTLWWRAAEVSTMSAGTGFPYILYDLLNVSAIVVTHFACVLRERQHAVRLACLSPLAGRTTPSRQHTSKNVSPHVPCQPAAAAVCDRIVGRTIVICCTPRMYVYPLVPRSDRDRDVEEISFRHSWRQQLPSDLSGRWRSSARYALQLLLDDRRTPRKRHCEPVTCNTCGKRREHHSNANKGKHRHGRQ